MAVATRMAASLLLRVVTARELKKTHLEPLFRVRIAKIATLTGPMMDRMVPWRLRLVRACPDVLVQLVARIREMFRGVQSNRSPSTAWTSRQGESLRR